MPTKPSSSETDGRLVRGEATRDALRRAAIDCLIERGYAGTTTAEIARRAGVSAGLFRHHWPTKVSLIADAASHAQRLGLERVVRRWEGGDRDLGEAGRRRTLEFLFDLLAEPDMQVLTELAVVARTDADLAAAMPDLLRRIDEDIIAGARAAVGARAEDDPDYDDRLRAVLDLFRGHLLRVATLTPRGRAQARRRTLEVVAGFLDLPT